MQICRTCTAPFLLAHLNYDRMRGLVNAHTGQVSYCPLKRPSRSGEGLDLPSLPIDLCYA